MKITEEIKDALFIEFCDMEANEQMCLSKDAFKEAVTKALSLCGVVKSLPSKEFISQVAEKRALKFNYVNEIGYLRHKKSFELGAEFVKEHLEKQK